MNASKVTNGSEAEILIRPPRLRLRVLSGMRRGRRPKRSARKLLEKNQHKTSPGENNQNFQIGETFLPLLRERRLGTQLHQAPG
jgi:hypothetical protein